MKHTSDLQIFRGQESPGTEILRKHGRTLEHIDHIRDAPHIPSCHGAIERLGVVKHAGHTSYIRYIPTGYGIARKGNGDGECAAHIGHLCGIPTGQVLVEVDAVAKEIGEIGAAGRIPGRNVAVEGAGVLKGTGERRYLGYIPWQLAVENGGVVELHE